MSCEDADILTWNCQQYKVLWGLCIVTVFIYSIALILALRNIIYICRLRIKKSLILALYFFVILKEITTCAWILAFTIHPTDDWHSIAFWMWIVSLLAEFGVYCTVISTNFQLASSIQQLKGEITPETRRKMNCRAKAMGMTFLLLVIVPATLSWYGVVSLAAFIIISYTYTLIYLLRQLKAFPSENFESEIRSIKNQNYTFIFCLVLACVAIYLYVRADGDYTTDFKLEIIDLTLTCCFRIIWDLHFILVHRRVFGLTTFILNNHNESFLDQKSALDRKSTQVTH